MTHRFKNFIQQFTIALAAISSVVTCFALFFQKDVDTLGLSSADKSIIFGSIFIVCYLYSCFMNHIKTEVSFDLNPHFRLKIEQGDLFDKKGIIVIPVNEYFDTHVGDGIISPTSVHGKWIKQFYEDKIFDLDDIIRQKLSVCTPIGNTRRGIAKAEKYELGTCIDIAEGNSTYVLVALTHFNNANHAYLERRDYPVVFDKLMSHLQDMQIEEPIYMPLIGTGLSRLGRSPQRILNFLVDTIDFKYSELKFPQGMNIEIYDIDSVNLNDLEAYARNELAL